MLGWCHDCRAVAIEGLCPEHGKTQPLSTVNSIDVHLLTDYEKNLFNSRMSGLKLGAGLFLMYADRIFRKKVVCLDRPLLEVKLFPNRLRLTPLLNGEVEGMSVESFVNLNRPRVSRLTTISKSFAYWELQHAKNAIISFSGGKDSTVLADILKEYNLPRVFIDTRLEFPETYSYIDTCQNSSSVEIAKAGTSFFSLCKEKGFPEHGNRWCCKTQKFAPFAQYLEQKYGKDEVFVYTGERRWEGLYRLIQPLKKRHKYILNQQTIQPMLDWLALDVWCYIFDKGLQYNKIYETFDRAGCWLCPFGLDYRAFLLQSSHPKLHQALIKAGGLKPTIASSTTKSPCNEGFELNWGKMREPNGVGIASGKCGDTIKVYIKVETDLIIKAKFITDGCHSIIACGDAITELAKSRTIQEAIKLTAGDVLVRVSQVPESENHCADIAVEALKAAIINYYSMPEAALALIP